MLSWFLVTAVMGTMVPALCVYPVPYFCSIVLELLPWILVFEEVSLLADGETLVVLCKLVKLFRTTLLALCVGA